MSKYQRFGIAFLKEFLVDKGANPVFYVVNNTSLPGPFVFPVETVQNITRAELMDRIHSEAMAISTESRDMMFKSKDPSLQNLLSRFVYLQQLLYQTTLAFVKPFNSKEPERSPKNYYMEREWRVHGDVLFKMSHVRRIILPRSYVDRFRRDCPCYRSKLTVAPRPHRSTR